jgi:hypothetical protein
MPILCANYYTSDAVSCLQSVVRRQVGSSTETSFINSYNLDSGQYPTELECVISQSIELCEVFVVLRRFKHI